MGLAIPFLAIFVVVIGSVLAETACDQRAKREHQQLVLQCMEKHAADECQKALK